MLVVALDHDGDELAELAGASAEQQRLSPTFKPVFLVATADTRVLGDLGFAFEAFLPHEDWERLSLAGTYEDYRRGRVRAAERLYRPDTVIHVAPGASVELTSPPGDEP